MYKIFILLVFEFSFHTFSFVEKGAMETQHFFAWNKKIIELHRKYLNTINKPSLNLNSVLVFGWALGPIFIQADARVVYYGDGDFYSNLIRVGQPSLLSSSIELLTSLFAEPSP